MPRFLVRDLPAGGRVELRGAELRHLRSVLRLGRGDRVELFDGAGRAVFAEIRAIGPAAADLEIVGEIGIDSESPLSVTLAAALSKGTKLDWVVEKATELGVGRIVPFTSERTVPAPRDSKRRAERWRRIAAAAAAQSGRVRCPEVSEPQPIGSIFASAREHDVALLFREGVRRGLSAVGEIRPRTLLVITGPEGGFSDHEAVEAERSGVGLVGLGPRILRAETAPIAAVALCQSRWGDLDRGSGESAT